MGAADRIADTILRMGQIRAEGLQRSADIQARAQQNNAQIWSGALQSLGQLPVDIQKAKVLDTENQIRQGQLDQQKKFQNDLFNANEIYQFTTRPGPDGSVQFDEDKLPAMVQKMTAAGINPDVVEHFTGAYKGMNSTMSSFRDTQLKHQADFANYMLQSASPEHPLTPATSLAAAKVAQANGLANADDINKMMAAFNQGKDPTEVFKAIANYGKVGQKPALMNVPGGNTVIDENTRQPVFTAPAKTEAPKVPNTRYEAIYSSIVKNPAAPTPDELKAVDAAVAAGEPPKATAEKSLQRATVMLDGKRKEVLIDPDPKAVNRVLDLDGKPITNAAQRISGLPSAAEQRPEAGQQPEIEIKPGTRMYRVAQDIAYGTLTMADFNRIYGRAMGNAQTKAAIYDTARQLNPDFKPSEFELGYKLAGNPAIRQRLVAIDSLGPVIDQIEGLAQKADLTNIPALNKLLSAGKFAVGDKTITNYRQLQTLLGDEVGNALGVGSGSDLKTKLGLDLVNPNLGPQQFIASMEQIRSVLGARKETLLKQFGPYAGAAGGNAPAPAPTAPPGNSRDPLGILGR